MSIKKGNTEDKGVMVNRIREGLVYIWERIICVKMVVAAIHEEKVLGTEKNMLKNLKLIENIVCLGDWKKVCDHIEHIREWHKMRQAVNKTCHRSEFNPSGSKKLLHFLICFILTGKWHNLVCNFENASWLLCGLEVGRKSGYNVCWSIVTT
jgi:hypothetical protein